MTQPRLADVIVTARAGGERLHETLLAVLAQETRAPFGLVLVDATGRAQQPGQTPAQRLAALEIVGSLAAKLIARGLVIVLPSLSPSQSSSPSPSASRGPSRSPAQSPSPSSPVPSSRLPLAALAHASAPLAVFLDAATTPEGPAFLDALLTPLADDPDLALVLPAQAPHPRCDALGVRALDSLHKALAAHPRALVADGAAGWTAWSRDLHALCVADLGACAVRCAAALPHNHPLDGDRGALLVQQERFVQSLLEAGWARLFLPEARVLRTFHDGAGARLARLRALPAARKQHLRAAPPAALTKPLPPKRPGKSALLTAAARLAQKSARAVEVLRDEGTGGLLSRFSRPGEVPAGPWWTQHPYDLLLEPRRPVPPPPAAALSGPLTISFVVPAFYKGAGGHMTIFRLVRHLESFGHRCQLVFTSTDGLLPPAPVQIRQLVQDLFQPVKARCFVFGGGAGAPTLPDADVHVATAWDTAYVVDRRRTSGAAAYLVQDWEPGFYPVGTQSALAEETYRLGFMHLCAGPWLEARLRDQGARACHFLLAVDPQDSSTPPGSLPPPPARPRLAVYLRPLTPRRGFELVALALAEVQRARPDVQLTVYGTDDALSLPFEADSRGVLDRAGLEALYRSSTVGLSCSLSNYSLVPQEMMACGLPVVEVDTPSTRAVFKADVDAVLAPPNPLALAGALLRLLGDPELRASLRQNGLARAKSLSWETSARQVEQGLRRAIGHALGL